MVNIEGRVILLLRPPRPHSAAVLANSPLMVARARSGPPKGRRRLAGLTAVAGAAPPGAPGARATFGVVVPPHPRRPGGPSHGPIYTTARPIQATDFQRPS